MIVKGGFVHVAFALIKRITIGRSRRDGEYATSDTSCGSLQNQPPVHAAPDKKKNQTAAG